MLKSLSLALASVAVSAAVGVEGAAAKSPMPMPPRDFADAAAQSDRFEILEAQTALGQSRNPQVRAFAQRMIADHTGTSATLTQAAMKSGLPPPPPSLGEDQARMLSSLQSERGVDFDRTYAKQQMLAHTQALVTEQGYAADGADANLRQAARSAVPMIQQHLQEAQRMRAAFGGS